MIERHANTDTAVHLYRCSCGTDVNLHFSPTHCPVCLKPIAQSAAFDLSVTITLDSDQSANALNRESNVESDHAWRGKTLGHFKILERLGSGGMGQVFRALDLSLQRYVAVKVLPQQNTQRKARANRRLLQEAIAQARVNHENVVTIYFVGQDEDVDFLAMELVGYDSLATRLQAEQVPYHFMTAIARDLVLALRESYLMGIVHGDIKPTNILLNEQGRAKLSDFGMSRIVDSDADDQEIGGTPNYLAPELLNGDRPSMQSDMYALGVTLYEMTFGKLPVQLRGASLTAWRATHESAVIEFPLTQSDSIPKNWIKLLTRLLNKDPNKRFTDYDRLLAAISEVMPSETPPARAFPRAIAWIFDFVFINLAMIAFASIVSRVMHVSDGPLAMSGIAMTGFSILPLTIHFLVLVAWGQSIGRHLMSIRVVNQQGLQPSSTRLLFREIVRLLPLWASALIAYSPSEFQFHFVSQGLVILFVLISGVVAALNRDKMTLHDLLFKTRVVLDTHR
ncbi:MAG TPA: protein kinase [Pirellulaceae bacterium]|nr:protein kinase [Pirellulaceae bacterium]HMO92778.1 protein kinase [Pirellulaceae bacterium]HMP69360.1 protein kinase [Pirellulaceae bacterium]